jgi:ribonucleoside-diphosphate reductase beta chain
MTTRDDGTRPAAPPAPAAEQDAGFHSLDDLDRPETEEPPGAPGAVGLPGARELYGRWEIQQWSVARLGLVADRPAFAALGPFIRKELLAALAELEIGESCVSRTLSALADYAPTEPDQLYLCTQMADEARHVVFFQTYLHEVAEVADPDLDLDGRLGQASGYGVVFEPLLREFTGRVRERDGDPAGWYAALVHYHLITEGILAAAGLRLLRGLSRACGLRKLEEGLTNVSRDEARHLTFGISAARAGVAAGYADTVAGTYLSGVRVAARVLVNPTRRATTPVIRAALGPHAANLSTQWSMARRRMVRQLRLIGLADHVPRAERAWDDAFSEAFTQYRDLWGAEHPVPRARAVHLI